jgi:hypothetical protein
MTLTGGVEEALAQVLANQIIIMSAIAEASMATPQTSKALMLAIEATGPLIVANE